MFVDWQFTGENDELLDPARYQCREFFLLVDALYEGQPVAYCPYVFADNDSAMMRGIIQGFPKRLGFVYQTCTFAAPGLAAAQVAPANLESLQIVSLKFGEIQILDTAGLRAASVGALKP